MWLCAQHWKGLGHQVHCVIPAGNKAVLCDKKFQINEYHLIDELEKNDMVVRSPVRQIPLIDGSYKTVKPYDDR